jgi:hypothetical protein
MYLLASNGRVLPTGSDPEIPFAEVVTHLTPLDELTILSHRICFRIEP